MKSIPEIRERLDGLKGKAYWRSLDELSETEAFQDYLEKEFPRQAAPLASQVNRREFMKLLGASLALAGLSACARPPIAGEKLVPYVRAPEDVIPGKPLFYATALTQGGYAMGVLAESHMGRPTKVEGNPDHPASLGATDTAMQASTLTAYDPDRSAEFRGGTWTSVAETLVQALGDTGSGVKLLTGAVTSPTLLSQIQSLQSNYPELGWHHDEPLSRSHVRAGSLMAFGEVVDSHYDLSKAEVVLSLGADFMGSGAAKIAHSKAFARKRKVRSPEDHMNRLYIVESTPSITGSIADHRLSLSTAEIEALARSVAHEVGLEIAAEESHVADDWLAALVDDLTHHQGSSVVIAGDEQPAAVHALAHAINEALGNVGQTVFYTDAVAAAAEPLSDLVAAMNSGEVQTLVILEGNPVYNAPAELDFGAALSNVETSIHLGLYQDETAAAATMHIPQAHELESWGDARAFDGSISLIQPLMAPMYGGKSAYEVLAVMNGEDASSHDIVRTYWREQAEGDFEGFWRETLYHGVVADSAFETKDLTVSGSVPAYEANQDGLELLFRADPSIGDGSLSNNGWLQETPKPFTKLTWENAALVSPKLAEANDLRNGDVVTLSVDGRSIDAPVWIQPGQAENSITLHLGYGRARAGRIGDGLGFNAYRLRTSGALWSATGASLSKTSRRVKLASTQTHQAMEGTMEARHLIRHGTLEEYHHHPEHPDFVHPVPHHKSDLYPNFEYESYAWGMVIDQTVCTGCNACVVACQSENNIPIVGKEEVLIGREMHWIRIDGYYGGDLDHPEFYHQPINCMHCEKAPCEPVCPVGATVHDHEGLNVMVYNRCVGTRYCANNCPYKVRRYNFLQYAELDTTATTMALGQNPDVTVRSTGVMEKCTYCTQRISASRIEAEREGRSIRDGEVVTACQSACPTEAIVFGDINDANSAVAAEKASSLNYALLEELNTVPRTTFLARLSNPHPSLAGESAPEEAH